MFRAIVDTSEFSARVVVGCTLSECCAELAILVN